MYMNIHFAFQLCCHHFKLIGFNGCTRGFTNSNKLHMDFEIFGFFVNFTKDFAKISLDFNPSVPCIRNDE